MAKARNTKDTNISRQSDAMPRITQDGKDGDEETGFVTNITDSKETGVTTLGSFTLG